MPAFVFIALPLKRGAKPPKRCQWQKKRGGFGDIVLQTDRKGKFCS